MISPTPIETKLIQANGIAINVATLGEGPSVLLLHGWPHTWFLWRNVMPELAAHHRVIAPDLRGLGGSTRAQGGYDLHTLADDGAALLDALGVETASVVGIDLGAPVAWMIARRYEARVRKLVVMESMLGRLPGAERFLANGPPWWFGFHGVPGLAETVLEGHEAEYLDWFYASGTFGRRGVAPEAREAFLRAYTGREALRGGFEHYRAMGANAELVREAAARRSAIPTMAIGGNVVGDALQRQLEPITEHLVGHLIPACGHIIPEDQPAALLALLKPFLAEPGVR